MQEKLTIARPYAVAAFEYAEQHAQIDAWSQALEVLAMAVSDSTLSGYIGHPNVSHEQMLAILSGVLGDRLDDGRRNFLEALIAARRLEVAPQIAQLFERRRAEAAGVVKVEVSSAFVLSTVEQANIEAAVKARLGRNCNVEASIDSSLIGGAVIKIGDSVIDLSLRGRLTGLDQLIH